MYETRPPRAGLLVRRQPIVRAPAAAVKGRFSVRFLDGDGRPTLVDVIDRHGVARRRHELPERENLITNYGMDQIHNVRFSFLRDRLQVGTGTTPPAFADTTLAAFALEGTTAGLVSTVQNNTTDDVWEYVSTVSRRVTMDANYNLTEFGFRYLDTDSLAIRSLFRDEAETPVTISLIAGKIIEVQHSLYCEFPRRGISGSLDWEEYDATDTLVDTTSVNLNVGYTAFTGSGGSINTILWGAAGSLAGGSLTSALTPGNPIPSNAFLASFASGSGMTEPGYVPGSHQRVFSGGIVPITGANTETAFGHQVGHWNSQLNVWSSAVGWYYEDPSTSAAVSFAKLNTHTLAFPTVTVSWARAA